MKLIGEDIMKTNFDEFLYEFVFNNPKLKEIIKAGISPLYHALKTERAIKALTENKLGCYSTQRYWKDGKRRKDDEDDYNSGLWMRGISLTRDIEYAKTWRDVIFIFDQHKLKTKYKIIPYNWGYSIGGGYKQGSNVKREREEFLFVGVSDINNPKTGKPYKNDYRNFKAFDDMRKSTLRYIEPLDKYLVGFFVSSHFIDTMKTYSKDKLEILQKNKKYLGQY